MSELSADELDRMVDDARQIVERNKPLPDQSAVQRLLRYATSTPSTKEVALFARYQASRPGNPHDFYVGVAEAIEKRYAGDIVRTRRFLGLLTKARKAHDARGGRRG